MRWSSNNIVAVCPKLARDPYSEYDALEDIRDIKLPFYKEIQNISHNMKLLFCRA